mmetsp:Transcript_4060/g.12231  ORF Transcript_4060/g.12231 Transcript_4060/m.12231 type:complete len:342 (-) Transcript_4060:153-1178(-)
MPIGRAILRDLLEGVDEERVRKAPPLPAELPPGVVVGLAFQEHRLRVRAYATGGADPPAVPEHPPSAHSQPELAELRRPGRLALRRVVQREVPNEEKVELLRQVRGPAGRAQQVLHLQALGEVPGDAPVLVPHAHVNRVAGGPQPSLTCAAEGLARRHEAGVASPRRLDRVVLTQRRGEKLELHYGLMHLRPRRARQAPCATVRRCPKTVLGFRDEHWRPGLGLARRVRVGLAPSRQPRFAIGGQPLFAMEPGLIEKLANQLHPVLQRQRILHGLLRPFSHRLAIVVQIDVLRNGPQRYLVLLGRRLYEILMHLLGVVRFELASGGSHEGSQARRLGGHGR